MDFQDCVEFASKNRICHLATAEGEQPRVRPMELFFADNTGFYFETSSPKALYKQLQNNKKVELAFFAPGAIVNDRVLRVSGEVEFVDDIQLKARVLEERPYLKKTGIEGPEDPQLIVFRVYQGEAYIWTMPYSLRESEIEKIKF